jgi:hypothetical protein
LGKALYFNATLLIVVVGAWAFSLKITMFPELVMQATTYPLALTLITLFGSFPPSLALHANPQVQVPDSSKEEAQENPDIKSALEQFGLERINISVFQMILMPTSSLLAIGETFAANALLAEEKQLVVRESCEYTPGPESTSICAL